MNDMNKMNDMKQSKDEEKSFLKEKKLFHAMSEIDEELIEEARPRPAEKKRPDPKRWLAVAAAILIVGIVTPYVLDFSSSMPRRDPRLSDEAGLDAAPKAPEELETTDKAANYGPLLAVSYPQSYSYENYDAMLQIRDQNRVSGDFLKAVDNFGFRTASAVLTENKGGENVNYSPLSLYYALSIAASGAGGETAAELHDLLGVTGPATSDNQAGKLYRNLYFDNEIGKFLIANSLWLDDDMNGEPIFFKDDFVKNAAENYYASSHSVDFSDPATAGAMAAWIAENTNGTLVPELEFDAEQILSIINTVYFHDEWTDRFDVEKTEPGSFYLSNGGEVEIDFMKQSFITSMFYRGDGYTRASLNLKNGGSMVFILPDEGVSPGDLVSSQEKLEEVFRGGEFFSGEVVWEIPKFSFKSKLDLKETLKALGIESSFLPDADFSGITDHLAYISSLTQETHIAVNEDGVEASAFTEMGFAGAMPPEDRAEMILNRPFIFGITAYVSYPDTNSCGSIETPYFIGICENPTA
jgi:serine protease inhibitor